MKEEIFNASDKTKTVTALGMTVHCNITDLHLYVDGVDVTKNVDWAEITITIETVEKKPEEKKHE